MTKKTRYFIFGSVAFLIIGLSIGLVAYYGGAAALSFSRASGPNELRYVPGDAVVVAYANVRQVMDSEFRREVHKMEPAGKERGQQEFRDKTGIDIEKDIDSVTAWAAPEQGATSPDKGGVVLARGKFDEVKIEGLAREHGGTVRDYKGKRIISAHPMREQATDQSPAGSRHEANEIAVAFIEPGLVAVGSVRAIERAIDTGTSANITGNADMMKLVQDVDGGTVWAVGRFDALASQAHLPENVASQIPPIQYFSASGRIDGGVDGTISVQATTPDGAKNLAAVINGFLALGRMQLGTTNPKTQALKGVLDTLAPRIDDKTVSVSFSLPADVLQTFGARHEGQSPEMLPRK